MKGQFLSILGSQKSCQHTAALKVDVKTPCSLKISRFVTREIMTHVLCICIII